ncbi:MAG: hypothetical protein LBL77_03685 [Endomicrobium sp.]|jgi:hypothetical protein|nr:hypothetical protein [Endomicrobium sp.]
MANNLSISLLNIIVEMNTMLACANVRILKSKIATNGKEVIKFKRIVVELF